MKSNILDTLVGLGAVAILVLIGYLAIAWGRWLYYAIF